MIASFIDPLFKLEWLESIDINQSKKDSLTSFTKHLIIAECQKMLATEKLNQSNGSSSSSSTPSPASAPVLASTSSATLTKQPSFSATSSIHHKQSR